MSFQHVNVVTIQYATLSAIGLLINAIHYGVITTRRVLSVGCKLATNCLDRRRFDIDVLLINRYTQEDLCNKEKMINRSDRTINTEGGDYNAHVSGDYVQGSTKSQSNNSFDSASFEDDWEWANDSANSGNGKNYTENQGGQKVERWF